MAKKKAQGKSDYGNYVVLNGEKLQITQHPTDFSVQDSTENLDRDEQTYKGVARMSAGLCRARAKNAGDRDALMDAVRKRTVAHHLYVVDGTDEEIAIDENIILTLRNEGTGELEGIIDEFKLEYVRAMADAHVLRVTDATGRNPIRTANEIAERPEVASCSPNILQQIQYHQAPVLFDRQWYLTADLISHPAVRSNASAEAPEAWTITTGNPDIVVAVIDDGFDLGHPVFAGTRIHPDARTFVAGDTTAAPEGGDFHGTPVASISVGSHTNGAMRGIAPSCTFLPVQIPFGPDEDFVSTITMLDVFEFVSGRADVVNCSFGFSPSSFQRFPQAFRNAVTQLTLTGGRRGNGLVVVFSAGNDDSPTFLSAADNVNGVRFLGPRDPFTGQFTISRIPANRTVFTAYPMIPGLVIVGAMSSRTRKSGYSNWGPHLTVTAPSSNAHELNGAPNFTAAQPGLGQIAASNRPGRGTPSRPLVDDQATVINEALYTERFGGTSGAAPVVAGVVGLMLSANPTLSAGQVRQVLEATADTDLDTDLDLNPDPNLQGLGGAFVGGRSRFFGAGKVNAARAVRRAQSLPGGISTGTGTGSRHGSVQPNLGIPDANPQGIVSHIDIPGSGSVGAIELEVDITHTYRGDLRVNLVSPEGFVAELHRMQGSFLDDLQRVYRPSNNQGLADFVTGGIEGGGRWTLQVSDNLRRDVGTLNSWSLDLRP